MLIPADRDRSIIVVFTYICCPGSRHDIVSAGSIRRANEYDRQRIHGIACFPFFFQNVSLLVNGHIPIISISVIAFVTVTSNLSTSVGIPIDKTTSLKPSYDNIRKEFGIALKYRLEDRLDYSRGTVVNLVNLYFKEINEIFVFYIGTLKNNYFNAQFVDLIYNDGKIVGISALLTVGTDTEYIQEMVNYELR